MYKAVSAFDADHALNPDDLRIQCCKRVLNGTFARLMRDEDDLCTSICSRTLEERGNGNGLGRECAGYAAENTGGICGIQTDKVAADPVVGEGDGIIRLRSICKRGNRRIVHMRCCIQDITTDGTRGGLVACTAALEHHVLAVPAVNVNGIQGAVHAGKRVLIGKEGRMNADLNGISGTLSDGEQFEGVSHLSAVGDVVR